MLQCKIKTRRGGSRFGSYINCLFVITLKSVSRFARNTVDSLSTIRKLKEAGVEVWFEKENIQTFDSKGELLITILSSLAQEESRSISENVTWGWRKRFSDGKVSMAYRQFLGYEKGEDGLRHAHAKIRQNGNAGCPMGFAYNDFFDLLENPGQPSQLVSFDPSGPELRPAGEYLVGTECGFYEQQNGLTKRMFDYALHNGLEFCGPAYTVYLLDAASVCDAEQFLLQVAVQVQRNEGN